MKRQLRGLVIVSEIRETLRLFTRLVTERDMLHEKDYITKITKARGVGEQGWCSGESARLPPMCPGFDSRTRRHMWAEFVGSLLCSERFFSGNSGFPLSSKTNI